jgi:hypothetical protein
MPLSSNHLLLSNRALFVTGSAMTVDGGIPIRL